MMKDSVRKTITGQQQYRTLTVTREMVNEESRTVALSFASELPVERFYGFEILACNPSAVRLGRLTDGGPLLDNHNWDRQAGVVEEARVDEDAVCRAVVRFSRSASADELFQDVIDGIKRKVSVGYMIHEILLDRKEGDKAYYRATDWEPYEISIVSIPADSSVGVGRSVPVKGSIGEEDQPSAAPPEKTEAAGAVRTTEPQTKSRGELPMEDIKTPGNGAPETPKPSPEQLESERVREIEAIKTRYAGRVSNIDKLADEAVKVGMSVEAFRGDVYQRVTDNKPLDTSKELGLSDKELKSFSFTRLISALANPTDTRLQRAAAFEFEVSAESLKKDGRGLRGNAQATIPFEVLTVARGRRDLIVTTGTMGGYTVGTNMLGASFIDVLRNRLVFTDLGATYMMGLNGFVAIPAQTAATTAYWVAENVAPTEGAPTYGQVTLSPKTVGAWVDASRRLLIQSSVDVEALIQRDLAAGLAVAIEAAAINGTSTSSQPTGILNTSGIGTSTGGANGAAPTWANIVALESELGIDNADIGALAYLTNARVRGKLKQTTKSTSAVTGFVWDDGEFPLNGYRAAVTSNVPSNITKGTTTGSLSAIIFGNFSDLLLGFWGNGIDILVDPYTGSSAGTVRIRSLADVDVAVRHAESFAAMPDALTT